MEKVAYTYEDLFKSSNIRWKTITTRMLADVGISHFSITYLMPGTDLFVPFSTFNHSIRTINKYNPLFQHNSLIDYVRASDGKALFLSTFCNRIKKLGPLKTRADEFVIEARLQYEEHGFHDIYLVPTTSYDKRTWLLFSLAAHELNRKDFQRQVRQEKTTLHLLISAIAESGTRCDKTNKYGQPVCKLLGSPRVKVTVPVPLPHSAYIAPQ